MNIAKTTVTFAVALLTALASAPASSRPLKITAHCALYPVAVEFFKRKKMTQVLAAASNDDGDMTEIWMDDKQDHWALVLHRRKKGLGDFACVADYGRGVAATRNFIEKGLPN